MYAFVSLTHFALYEWLYQPQETTGSH